MFEESIETELAVLSWAVAAGAGTALLGSDLLRSEWERLYARPQYRPMGPALVRVAAAGLATFPAAIAPAVAATPPTGNFMLAMARRPVDLPPRTPLFAGPDAFTRPKKSPGTATAPASVVRPVLAPALQSVFKRPAVSVGNGARRAVTLVEVAAGDSLYSLAAAWLGSGARWPELQAANRDRLGPANTIRPGQRLVIPRIRVAPAFVAVKPPPAGARRYRVASGDSLYTIAARHLGSPLRWKEIVAMNQAALSGKTTIYPRQWLLLPHMG